MHLDILFNEENRFTGWTYVDLSTKEIVEAGSVGQILRNKGYIFDIAFTSVLKRTIPSLWVILEEMEQIWVPESHSWRLNERHYEVLLGFNKAETEAKSKAEQVSIRRRSYSIQPQALK